MRGKWKGDENVLESLNYTLKNKEINVFFIIERILQKKLLKRFGQLMGDGICHTSVMYLLIVVDLLQMNKTPIYA